MNESMKKSELFERLSRRLDIPAEQIESSCGSGDPDELMKSLDGESAARVRAVLNDPEKTRELLNSPQAQAIMKLLEKK